MKKKMKSKAVAYLLTAVFALSLLAGCGARQEEQEEGEPDYTNLPMPPVLYGDTELIVGKTTHKKFVDLISEYADGRMEDLIFMGTGIMDDENALYMQHIGDNEFFYFDAGGTEEVKKTDKLVLDMVVLFSDEYGGPDPTATIGGIGIGSTLEDIEAAFGPIVGGYAAEYTKGGGILYDDFDPDVYGYIPTSLEYMIVFFLKDGAVETMYLRNHVYAPVKDEESDSIGNRE